MTESLFIEAWPLGVLVAFLYMFFYMDYKKNGLKDSVSKAYECFRLDRRYRGAFVIGFYLALVLYRTVLGRSWRLTFFEDLFLGWGFEGESFFKDAILNLGMLFPLPILLFHYYGQDLFDKIKFGAVCGKAFKICFLFSLGIEIFQLVFGYGSMEIPDLVYNTLGGVLGGIVYYLVKKLR